MDPLKKMLGSGLEPRFHGWESTTLLMTPWEPVSPQGGTIISNTYHFYISRLRHHIFVLYITSSCRETELKTMLSSYFYDAEMRVKQVWKKCCKLSASKNCKMAQEWIRLVLRGNYFKKVFLRFLLMNLYLICVISVVQQPHCLVNFKTSRSNRMITAILNLLMLSDQEDGY